MAARLHTPQSLSAACPGRRLSVHQSWRELRLLQTLVPCQQQPPMDISRETPSALTFPLYRTQAILFSNPPCGLLISSNRRMGSFLETAVQAILFESDPATCLNPLGQTVRCQTISPHLHNRMAQHPQATAPMAQAQNHGPLLQRSDQAPTQ